MILCMELYCRIWRMPSAQEKSAFAQRLKTAIKQFSSKQLAFNPSSRPIKGGADLARQFNLKYPGESGVSIQAVHKWLNGEAIPRPDKIKTLSTWLGVSEYWLHYGSPPEPPASPKKRIADIKGDYTPSPQILVLANRIKALSDHQCYLIEELVAEFCGRLPS